MQRKKLILAAVLKIAKSIGLFALARRLTAQDLRILCYHGAALRDEHRFSPGLFMSKETFAARMDFLARQGYPVVGLEEAVARLDRGGWPRAATVITIDDGWFGTYEIMAPILQRHGFPATLYLATYYLEKQTQVFNIATNYVLWRARHRTLELGQVSDMLAGTQDLADARQRSEASKALIRFAENMDSAEERQELFRKLCSVLGLDATEIEREHICAFMGVGEATQLQDYGVDIQLHTHRHRFPPDDLETARAEIEDNRRALAPAVGSPRQHFCYPSGDYEKQQIAWLKPFGIVSATTTRAGFTRPNSSPYELPRFLDSERVSSIEFEAEMCGFFELVRRCGYAI